MKKINIIVVGASGKMGQAIIKETNEDSDLNLVMAVDIKTSPRIGKDAGELMGVESNIKISSDLLLDKGQADILIDFTRPEASMMIDVFPEPLGPTIETISSLLTEKLIPFKTSTGSTFEP